MSLTIYSIIFVVLIIAFMSMWLKEINNIVTAGTTLGYTEAPTGFWTIHVLDLGFTIPLGFLSVYLLWTRPNETYSIQIMFYGFFVTMLLAVNCMAVVMYLNRDPNFAIGSMVIFGILLAIVTVGLIFIIGQYETEKKRQDV